MTDDIMYKLGTIEANITSLRGELGEFKQVVKDHTDIEMKKLIDILESQSKINEGHRLRITSLEKFKNLIIGGATVTSIGVTGFFAAFWKTIFS